MNTNAMRIAHLSGMCRACSTARSEQGSGRAYSMGHRFLSFGRPLDADLRKGKLSHALSAARRVGADHIVISGDLTEIGSPRQSSRRLAEVLHDSGIPTDRMTLVPGNLATTSTPPPRPGSGHCRARSPRSRR